MNLFITKRNALIVALVLTVVFAFFASYIFSGQIILPQYLLIFGHKIYFYGLILALGVFAGYYFARHRLNTIKLSTNEFDDVVLILIITGFIGARLYHVISSYAYYSHHWIQIFYVWNGGLSIFGAIILGLIGLYIYKKYYLSGDGNVPAISFLALLDFLVPSVVLGQAIGRLGNLFNYEIYGPPTNLPWRMFVPLDFRIPPFETFQFFHPLFLYESLACLLILLILVKWLDIADYLRIKPRAGQLFFIWLGLYNVERLLTESLRIDSPYFMGIKQNYITAGVLVIISLFFFIRSLKTPSHELKSSQNL